MTRPPTAQDWSMLGIEPTTDADTVRRAYRGRLREVGPETDPDGFQALRAAYEAILSAAGSAAAPPSPAPEQDEAVVATFLAELRSCRIAGHEVAAITLVDQTIDAHAPGSATAEAIADAAFEHLALSRNISPGLFRHLVDRLDWRDIQGRAARRDPERHAFLLDRIAAEDWYHDLVAADADRRIETIMIEPEWKAIAALQAAPIDIEQRQHIRDLFDRLLEHSTFVLTRFDGGTLALLREFVEGPPLVAEPAPAAAPQPGTDVDASDPVGGLVSPQRRRLIRYGVIGGVAALTVGRYLHKGSSGYTGKDTALAATVALPLLKDPKTAWLDVIPGPDGVKVDWAPVMRMRHAIKELHVGYNEEEPSTLFPLPEFDAPIGFLAPSSIKTIVMRIRYSDGTWSEVRRYDIQKASR